jgi:hypothetical protein
MAEIERLKNEGREISQQIADLEKEEFTIKEFTKIKIDDASKRINSMFDIVQFQLYDWTNENKEKPEEWFEACIAKNKKGVPISVTNAAEKINAGLDIINTLSKFYNVSAPIFCDGAESNNHYIDAGSQMIFLKVTTEKELTISNQ